MSKTTTATAKKKPVTFQKTYSRNSNDWDLVETQAGRMMFVSNGAGVERRLGLVVSFLKSNPGTTIRAIAAHLRSIHNSYSNADVSAPMERLLQAGLVTSTGKGFKRTYTLQAPAPKKAAKK